MSVWEDSLQPSIARKGGEWGGEGQWKEMDELRIHQKLKELT